MSGSDDTLTSALSLIPVAVLAAGASSRMRRHKLLLPLAGRPLISWAVRAATASRANDVIVVLGRENEAVRAVLEPNRSHFVVNLNAGRGQATSLAIAVGSVAASAPGLVIILADQPFMDMCAIDSVLYTAELSSDRVAMGEIDGQLGHPVYLPRRLFAEIATLVGDVGARDIIRREQPNIIRVALDNRNAHMDVDTPSDYTRAVSLAYTLATPDA